MLPNYFLSFFSNADNYINAFREQKNLQFHLCRTFPDNQYFTQTRY